MTSIFYISFNDFGAFEIKKDNPPLSTQAQQSGGQLPKYSIRDIGALGSYGESTAKKIKKLMSGEVAVVGTAGREIVSPVVWTKNGGLRKVGQFANQPDGGQANSINRRGEIVGDNIFVTPFGMHQAFISAIDSGVLNLVAHFEQRCSSANDISDSGTVVGFTGDFSLGIGDGFAYYRSASELVILPKLPNDPAAEAFAVNNQDIIVGFSGNSAVKWQYSTIQKLPGAICNLGSRATDINNNGEIIGTEYCPDGNRSFILEGGSTRRWIASETGVVAKAINDQGTVVGTKNGEAFIWSKERGLEKLLPLAGNGYGQWSSLIEANDIDEQGRIIGSGMKKLADGRVVQRGFLLEPLNFLDQLELGAVVLYGSQSDQRCGLIGGHE